MKRVDFNASEIATEIDLDAIGKYAVEGVDHVVGGAIGYPNHWAAFTVSVVNASVVRVSPGRLFKSDIIYSQDDNKNVDLMLHLPNLSTNRRWVGLVAQGAPFTADAQRFVETDPVTENMIEVTVPKTVDRRINIVPLVGDMQIAELPAKPVVPADECCIAFVLLSQTGIVTIVPGTQWRVRNLYEVEGRVTSLEVTLSDTIQRTAVLETNLANLASQIGRIPRPELMTQIVTDVAALRRYAKLPSAARAYWYDPGLTQDDWDKANSEWLGRVRQGVRFAYAQIVDSQMALLAPNDTAIKVSGSLLLPAWTEATRISVDGSDGYKDISQQVHTVTNAVQNTVSYTSISYGPSFGVCQNAAEWGGVANVRAGETFNVNGTPYVSSGVAQGVLPDQNGVLQNYTAWNSAPESVGHTGFAVQQVEYTTWSETYWSYYTVTYGVNGSIYGQTLLNAQPCIATSIELKFTRVDAAGAEVHLFLCECDHTGAPQFKSVLTKVTKTAAQLAVGWVKFAFTEPVLLDTGKRYAWYTVTVGNHAIATVANNKFAQGSLFWCTDGAWAQGDPLNDFAFKLNVAQFAATRTVIEMQPLQCSLGMTELQLMFASWAPAGTSLTWEIQATGDTVWHPILTGDPTPLNGLPALARLRVIMVNTTDLAPAIRMDHTARSAAMRVRSDMKAPSKVQPFGLSTSLVTLIATLDQYDAAYATYTPKILIGGTPVSASVTSIQIDPDKPNRRTVSAVFNLGSPTTSAAAFPAMTTSSLTKVPFIQDIVLSAS